MAEQTPKVNPGFLARAVARKRAEVGRESVRRPLADLRARAADLPPARPFVAALRAPAVRVIAEFKRRSPSAGRLGDGADAAARARLYEDAGAAAVSVLTDSAFGGSLADLRAIASAVDIPVLRKDFLIDPWQAWESRAEGADAALLVVAAVDDVALAEVADAAREAGLELLIEVHRPGEVARARAIRPGAVGVNARDLGTLRVSRTAGWAAIGAVRAALGPEVVLVAESGIRGPADVRRVARAGADAILVGEHLMRAPDPGAALARLIDAAAPAEGTSSA